MYKVAGPLLAEPEELSDSLGMAVFRTARRFCRWAFNAAATAASEADVLAGNCGQTYSVAKALVF
jgi:hypothetical protein